MPADLIKRLVNLIEYQQHLQKTQQDWETRWENVQELITFASEENDPIDQSQSETDVAGVKQQRRATDTEVIDVDAVALEEPKEESLPEASQYA